MPLMNKILGKAFIASITTQTNKVINHYYATSTETWERVTLSEKEKQGFVKAVEKAKDALPSDTDHVIMAEKEHMSQDQRSHWTADVMTEKGEHLETDHFYLNKK